MSIIERVAELLESESQTRKEPSIAREGADTHEPNRIERAAGDLSQIVAHNKKENLAVEPTTTAKTARSTDMTTRTLKVDLDRLRKQGIITPDGERNPITEGFRRIKRQILTSVTNPKSGVPANLVLVTSALVGEGKTFCAINLAISIALEMDRTVLLVDADVASPSVPEALGFEAGKGLMDVLLDRRLELAEVLWNTDIEKLKLLPAGTKHQRATEHLASDAMSVLLREMATRYRDRIIIFDSPPLLEASEAAVLATQMGQIVLVVESGKTTEVALKTALGRIDSSHVTGLVLNKGGGPGLGQYYGRYGYGAA